MPKSEGPLDPLVDLLFERGVYDGKKKKKPVLSATDDDETDDDEDEESDDEENDEDGGTDNGSESGSDDDGTRIKQTVSDTGKPITIEHIFRNPAQRRKRAATSSASKK